MRFFFVLAVILVSAHYSLQEEEVGQAAVVSDTGEGKPVQLPAQVSDDGEEKPVQLPARDTEDEDVLTARSAQEDEVLEEEKEEQGKPVQLPARDVNEEITKRSQKVKKCSRKCVRNAECVKGRCRCKKGHGWSSSKRRCVRRWRICSRKRRCGKNARCVSGICRCRRGYRWNRGKKQCVRRNNPPKKCSKKCVKNAVCVRGKCRCRRGYRFTKGKKQCVRTILWLKVGRGQVCEHESLTLRCSKGRVIRVFYSLYGRRNKRICAKGKPIKTTKCKAKNANKIAKKSCEGKQTCRLRASNKVYGDPCKGTFKYLTVIYGCRKRCAKNAFFNGNICKCKKGYKGHGFKKCIKRKTRRDLKEQEEEKRDVTDEGIDVSENGLERV
nr:multiple epidermal growth factor-like domains protein 10 isoform X2 [Crassostrea gigas]